jgi:hypothetical protein
MHARIDCKPRLCNDANAMKMHACRALINLIQHAPVEGVVSCRLRMKGSFKNKNIAINYHQSRLIVGGNRF